MDYSKVSKKSQKRGLQVINNRHLKKKKSLSDIKKFIQNQMSPGTASYRKSDYDDGKRVVNTSKGPIITNLKTKEKATFKAMGGMAKYYKDGGEVMTGREGLTAAQKTLPDFLQKKILQAKKKK